jgi:hypothetical protein
VRILFAIAVALPACDHTDQRAIDPSLGARQCPTHLDLELIGSESRFDPGFSGSTHGVGLATGSNMTVEILSCDDECRRCEFHGPVRSDPARQPVVSQRCLNDISRTCSADGECGAAGPCRFVFPPITSRIMLPTCSLAYFEPVAGADPSPIQGTADLFTGESDMPVLNLNIQTTLNACTDCAGDPKPFDGVAGGTCVGGTTACDINGIGTAVASQTSYDCAPPPSQGLNIKLPASGTSTASRKWVLDETRPKCTAGGSATSEPCFCGVCKDGAACFADRDCAPATRPCGFAGSTMTPVDVSNNSCTGTCLWNEATQRGKCSNDPLVNCFPDGKLGQTLIARGAAEVGDGFYISQLANLVCLPSFKNAVIDQAGGFPGPFLFQSRFRVTPRYGGEGT